MLFKARLHQHSEHGQGLVDYALILVSVAIVSIVILAALGGSVASLLGRVACALDDPNTAVDECDLTSDNDICQLQTPEIRCLSSTMLVGVNTTACDPSANISVRIFNQTGTATLNGTLAYLASGAGGNSFASSIAFSAGSAGTFASSLCGSSATSTRVDFDASMASLSGTTSKTVPINR